MTRSIFILLGVGVLLTSPALSLAQPVPLPAGLKPHVQGSQKGSIDWTRGYIIARGVGKLAPGKADAKAKAGAQRAATLVAARNAAALAAGLKLGPAGLANVVKDGEVRIQATIRGYKESDVRWVPKGNPTECRLKLRVPLWGVRSVATVYEDKVRQAVAGQTRLELEKEAVDVSEVVLIIDARGTSAAACLFPVIADDTGAVLYDVNTLDAAAKTGPPAQYCETDLTHEKLRACADTAQPALATQSPANADSYWAFQQGDAKPPVTTSQAATKPAATTQASKRRVVVKASKSAGADNTQIVLTKQDAESLKSSAEGASLLRSGKVVIVVDSAAAGIQGRAPGAPTGDTAVAAAR